MPARAPIILFVYNRPVHTRHVIEALQKNIGAAESDLIVYSDGSVPGHEEKVTQVREYLKSITGFKSVTIVERAENWGLADSIVSGVTEVIEKYGRVIVLEDDLVSSPFFLSYMNDALQLYENDEQVMHVSAFLPRSRFSWLLPSTFFLHFMSCWGWGTWGRAWRKFNPDAKALYDELVKRNALADYNLDGVLSFHEQLEQNIRGEIKTWATKWFTTIYLEGGLCLYPRQTLVQNIGFDGTGVHCETLNARNPYAPPLAEKRIPVHRVPLRQSRIGRWYLKRFYARLSREPLTTFVKRYILKAKRLVTKLYKLVPKGAWSKKNIPEDYYNRDYFLWQKEVGEFGGSANLFKFREHILPHHHVLDFGCGGGYLLKNIVCAQKYGVEINAVARNEAEKNGVKVFATLEDVPNKIADIVISNHTLEHVRDPYGTLVTLRKKLRKGGLAVFVVPHQSYDEEWVPNDINQHLYTWNRLCLGNLFSAAGFTVQKVELIQHQWPPDYLRIYQEYGEERFHEMCRKEAQKNNNYQIRIVASND